MGCCYSSENEDSDQVRPRRTGARESGQRTWGRGRRGNLQPGEVDCWAGSWTTGAWRGQKGSRAWRFDFFFFFKQSPCLGVCRHPLPSWSLSLHVKSCMVSRIQISRKQPFPLLPVLALGWCYNLCRGESGILSLLSKRVMAGVGSAKASAS